MASNNQILSGNARMIPRTGEMILDPGPRQPVSIDTRSAVSTVKADGNAFARADLAGGEIGKAVGQVGVYMEQLALKQMEAINITKIAEGEALTVQANGEIAAALEKEPDETKWGEVASGIMTKTKEQIGKMTLSPAARDALDNHFIRWGAHRESQVKVMSAQQSFSKAKNVTAARLELAEETQDKMLHIDTLDGMERTGLISTEERKLREMRFEKRGEQIVAQAEADSRKALAEFNEAAIDADPFGYKVPDGLDSDLKMALTMRQRQVKGLRQEEVESGIADRMARGEIKSSKDILDLKDPALSDADKAKWATVFQNGLDDREREKARANAPANAAMLEEEIRAWDVEADPDRAKLRDFNRRKMELPVGFREDVDIVLDRKRKGIEPEPDKLVDEMVADAISESLRSGIFSKEPPPPAPAVFAPAADHLAYSQAMGIRKQVEARRAYAVKQAWRKETKGNPKVTMEEASAFLSRSMAAPLEPLTKPGGTVNANPPDWSLLDPYAPAGAEGAVGPRGAAFIPAPAASRVTSYGYQNDETPDTNSTAGIGAWVPDDEQAKIKRGEESDYKLKEGDFAVSRDVEKSLREAGIEPGDRVRVKLADGSIATGRWMDRTAETWEGKEVTGRWDFYRAGKKTKHDKEAQKVTGFVKAL